MTPMLLSANNKAKVMDCPRLEEAFIIIYLKRTQEWGIQLLILQVTKLMRQAWGSPLTYLKQL